MVVRSEAKVCPLEIVQIIKSISAREFFRLFSKTNRKYFWGGELWAKNYFVEILDNADEDAIVLYVKNQLKEIDKVEELSSQLERW